MFHCHNLIHEDHVMMAAFNVTLLEDLGYDFNTTIGFADPMDERFRSQDYEESDFSEAEIKKVISSYADLKAYESPESIIAWQNGQQGGAATATASDMSTPSTATTSQNASPASEAPATTPAPSWTPRGRRGVRMS